MSIDVNIIPLFPAKAVSPREDKLQTILVVDDEPIILTVCSRILNEAGFQVLAAGGAGPAIEICTSFTRPIDVALLDIIMPGKSGPELATDLIPVHPETAVVFMSGYDDYRFEKYRPFSFKWFLRKPFKPMDLLTIIQQALDDGRKRGPGREQKVTYIREVSME